MEYAKLEASEEGELPRVLVQPASGLRAAAEPGEEGAGRAREDSEGADKSS